LEVRDNLVSNVRLQLQRAFAYLQCFFDVEMSIDDIAMKYEPETEAEKHLIKVSEFKMGHEQRPVSLPFDMLTRAIMAAEVGEAPDYEATLLHTARRAMFEEKYIDSFRYSFMLIEAKFGDGKSRSEALKNALKSSLELRGITSLAIEEHLRAKQSRGSDTEAFLATSPSVDAVLDHLVDKRGYYFHGNIRRRDAWRPQDQAAAETLCLLSLEIANRVAAEAASLMFESELSRRHLENAQRVGAITTMTVKFVYRLPDEPKDRNGAIDISVPGTKATPAMSLYIAQRFLEHFVESAPHAELKSASATLKAGEDKVFDMVFHVLPDSKASAAPPPKADPDQDT
jgi:hypothetical protein